MSSGLVWQIQNRRERGRVGGTLQSGFRDVEVAGIDCQGAEGKKNGRNQGKQDNDTAALITE
jgi:hypothetical protein